MRLNLDGIKNYVVEEDSEPEITGDQVMKAHKSVEGQFVPKESDYEFENSYFQKYNEALEKIEKLNKELLIAKGEIASLEKQIERLNKDYKDSVGDEKYKESAEHYEKEYNDTLDKYNKLLKEKKKLDKKLEDVEELEESVNTLEESERKSKKEIKKYKKEIEELTESKEEAEEALKKFKSSHTNCVPDDIHKKVVSDRDRYKKIADDHEENCEKKILELTTKVKTFDQTVSVIETSKKAVESSWDALKKNCKELEEKMKTMEHNSTVISQLNQMKDSMMVLEDNVGEFTRNVETIAIDNPQKTQVKRVRITQKK